jgi:peroxiredoxin
MSKIRVKTNRITTMNVLIERSKRLNSFAVMQTEGEDVKLTSESDEIQAKGYMTTN